MKPNLVMTPAPGERLVRYVGDRLRFHLRWADGEGLPHGWKAHLRTNLGRAARIREEIIRAHFHQIPPAVGSWHDLPMSESKGEWITEVTLAEVGFFKAKAYLTDPSGHQHWPEGSDFGLSVHPDLCRTNNTIYCAFTRQFGESRLLESTRDEHLESQLRVMDQRGYTVIPPSGKLRDVARQLPHIIHDLGFQIIHLLPVNPTPTTFARYGRFGSPYACEDLTAIDPALVEFDRKTTGVDQFQELAYQTHALGGRLFLDVVINHTGWGATLQENHPEWYLRGPDGSFVSPGAWGVTWEDLAELEHLHPELWLYLSDVFLTWCRRGVDGFRCDAGYKVPLAAWQYIISRVRQEFPNTVFLLEGLGGPWATTEELLTEGGMQWAYSELFQNFSGREVGGYLDYALRQSDRVGLYVHYSETHDNNRLAATGKTWSLLRNQLCALTSVSGAFGITAGVEWLAAEKIFVHQCGGLSWGAKDNIIGTLAQLNQLLSQHPCFFDGARLQRLSPDDSPVYALSRTSAEGRDHVLVLINTDTLHERSFGMSRSDFDALGSPEYELLGHAAAAINKENPDWIQFSLRPASCLCYADAPVPQGLMGRDYRDARARAAWAVQALAHLHPAENLGNFAWNDLADRVDTDPTWILHGAAHLDSRKSSKDLIPALQDAIEKHPYPPVVEWSVEDRTRVVPVPPKHWILLRDSSPFRARLESPYATPTHVESIPAGKGFVACFFHQGDIETALDLHLERYPEQGESTHLKANLLGLPATPNTTPPSRPDREGIALLTNGRGGMARLGIDFGRVRSKYDCALGANLNTQFPVDRHVFVKRLRMWAVADGFISALNWENLVDFHPGPPSRWQFEVHAGDGRKVRIEIEADMLEGRNATVFRVVRLSNTADPKCALPAHCHASLTVRVDIEDRNFHQETKFNEGADHHFTRHSQALNDRPGFSFIPSPDRELWVYTTSGEYHAAAEWCRDLPHEIERTRGQEGAGDAFSPGWFSLPLQEAKPVSLVLSAESTDISPVLVEQFHRDRQHRLEVTQQRAGLAKTDKLGRTLAAAAQSYLVRRDDGRTVIAGYPWFLDWGRDSLICARGLISAGLTEEVKQLLHVFGRFEQQGTLPNTIHGDNASNRDTSDAPLWYGIVAEELAQVVGRSLYASPVAKDGRTIAAVLSNIARGYRDGTPNGIVMDRDSALIWSPSHFTWMDTNYPAGTPREGYPVEIQVLWIRLLRQLARIDDSAAAREWKALADQATENFLARYWMEDKGYLADNLRAGRGTPARAAVVDDALRSNGLFAVSLGLLTGEKAQRCVEAAARHLIVPGALRTLAPLPVSAPLPIHSKDGSLLNDPSNPYWGRYEGDEDTRRKPAYHNGTAWTWTFPTFCEALAIAWNRSPESLSAAQAYLGSVAPLLRSGCIGHLPEIIDGDAPHTPRGCDAQAWGTTEALRVWRWLHS